MEDKYLEFQRRKLKYEADLIKYQEALARWNALSDTEKGEAHRSAEGLSLIGWSLLVAGGIVFLLYQHFNERLSGDAFWVSWAAATLLVAALAVAFNQVVGRLARGIAFSAIFGAICWFVIKLLRENVSNPPSEMLQYIVAGIAGLIGAVGEALGWYHASGEPKPPSAP
ncbi:MAG: hypothetical protein Q8N04_06630 [Nitrospira sp.]|nr:hypothetical protein [Nitrospira sp.]